MKRFINYIGSRRFAIYLLVITTLVILMSNLLPNLSIMDATEVQKLKEERPLIYSLSSSVGVSRLTKSTYFQVIPLFVFLSITVCTLRRFRSEIEKSERGEIITERSPVSHSIIMKSGSLSKEDVVSLLKKKRWSFMAQEGERAIIYAKKGEKGIWGSISFHIGMDVALIGILVSATTGIDGKLRLTEKFPVDMPEEIQGVRESDVPNFPLSEIMLEEFKPVFEGGFPVRYDGKLKGVGRDGGLRRYDIGVNRLLRLEDYKFIFTKAGFAPRFVLVKKDGSIVTDAVVNLNISMPGVVDSFRVIEEGMSVKVEMFPDYYQENGVHKTKGKFPFNPVVFVEVDKDGKVIGRGFIPMGKRVSFDEYTLEFAELKHWMELIVSRDMGVPIITAGFILIAVGLCFRFVLNEKHLWIIMNKSDNGLQVDVGGRARFFPAMFEDEMKGWADDLRSKAGDVTSGD